MPTIQQCIARVNTSPGLHTDECHATTEVVSQALSGLAIGQCESGTFASWKAELARVAQSGATMLYMGPDELDRFTGAQVAHWTAIIRRLGIVAQ